MSVNLTEKNDFGNEFDFGILEAEKIHLKVGSGLVSNAGTGYIPRVDPSFLGTNTTNQLTSTQNSGGTSFTSIVNGVTVTLDIVQLVKNAETKTTASYDPATKIFSYTGEDGVQRNFDFSALGIDVFVNGGTFDPSTWILTLTDNSGITPNIVLDLSELKKVSTAVTSSIALSGTGEPQSPLNANLILDLTQPNLVSVGNEGVVVKPSDVKALATVEIQDAFGNHLGFIYA